MSQYGLFSDLDGNRLHDRPGLGGPDSCIAVFESEEAATKFATDMILACPDCKFDNNSDDFGESILDQFQWSLSGCEYFHVFPIVPVPVS